jgi:hypothetical protein
MEMAGGDVPWDSWLGEDDRWRVRAVLGEHRSATWAWDPRTRRLRALDDVARTIQTGGAAVDALDAVLRPVATTPRPLPVEPPPAFDDEEPLPVTAEPVDETPPAAPPEPVPADRPKKRTSVPSWDEIVIGTTSRRPSPSDPD